MVSDGIRTFLNLEGLGHLLALSKFQVPGNAHLHGGGTAVSKVSGVVLCVVAL